MTDRSTDKETVAAARWSQVGAIVAAYAGTRAGLNAFASACRALRVALPDSRIAALCPEGASVRDARGMPDLADVIEYPSPGVMRRSDESALDATLRAVYALARQRASAALVFTERGWAPYAPAYLCYLAGIRSRAGFETEFGGAVLAPSIRPPASVDEHEDVARHLALLKAVGIEPAATTQRSLGCDR